MSRAPFQVLVNPYRKRSNGHFEYALMQRADDGTWQGIAGGGEDGETPFEAAIRETYEEACRLIKYDGSRTALRELDKRLKGNGPRG